MNFENLSELITELKADYQFNQLGNNVKNVNITRYVDNAVKSFSRIYPRENLYADINIVANQSYISLPDDFFSATAYQLARLKYGDIANIVLPEDRLSDFITIFDSCYQFYLPNRVGSSFNFDANGNIVKATFNLNGVNDIKISTDSVGRSVINLKTPFTVDKTVSKFNYNGLHLIDDETSTIPVALQDIFINIIKAELLFEDYRRTGKKESLESARMYRKQLQALKNIGYGV